jgi:hypothetical protein
MRSQGSIGAIVSTLILVFVVTGGLGICLLPSSDMGFIGGLFASLSPVNNSFAILTPERTLPDLIKGGIGPANISLGICSIAAGFFWMGISYGLLRSMASSFVVTVRRLAG